METKTVASQERKANYLPVIFGLVMIDLAIFVLAKNHLDHKSTTLPTLLLLSVLVVGHAERKDFFLQACTKPTGKYIFFGWAALTLALFIYFFATFFM